jgi:hypothetical protein
MTTSHSESVSDTSYVSTGRKSIMNDNHYDQLVGLLKEQKKSLLENQEEENEMIKNRVSFFGRSFHDVTIPD